MKTNEHTTHVLDTTVLINDPEVMYRMGAGTFVIPMSVIRQLDGLKKSDRIEVAKAARYVSNNLDRIGEYGDLSVGVPLSTGGRLKIIRTYTKVDGLESDADNKIVGTALSLKKEGYDVVLLTADTNMRIVARAYGIKTAPDLPDRNGGSGIHPGGQSHANSKTASQTTPKAQLILLLILVAMIALFFLMPFSALSYIAAVIGAMCFLILLVNGVVTSYKTGKGHPNKKRGGYSAPDSHMPFTMKGSYSSSSGSLDLTKDGTTKV